MATFITLTRPDGAAIAVNADEVLAVEPVPDTQLPAGIASASYLIDVGSQYTPPNGLIVQGAPAAVAAALAAGGATFVALTRADGAAIQVQGALVLSLEPVPTGDGTPSTSTYLIDVGSQYAAPTLAVQGNVATVAALLTTPPPASVIFRFNGANLAQFGPFIGFKSDFGFDPVGVPSVSLVPAPSYYPGRSAVRVAGVAFASGWWLQFLDDAGAPLELPDRYAIRAQLVAADDGGAGALIFGIVAFGEDDAGTTRAMLYERFLGFAGGIAQGVLNDRHAVGSTASLDNNGIALNASNFNRGGCPVELRVLQRPDGSNPAAWCIESEGAIAVAPFGGIAASADVGFNSADWNGRDLRHAGLFIYNGGGVITGSFDVLDLEIVAL